MMTHLVSIAFFLVLFYFCYFIVCVILLFWHVAYFFSVSGFSISTLVYSNLLSTILTTALHFSMHSWLHDLFPQILSCLLKCLINFNETQICFSGNRNWEKSSYWVMSIQVIQAGWFASDFSSIFTLAPSDFMLF